jgi:hypothetical protein
MIRYMANKGVPVSGAPCLFIEQEYSNLKGILSLWFRIILERFTLNFRKVSNFPKVADRYH